MEWIVPTEKNHTIRLVIDYRVESEGGLKGQISGTRFESHHSISGWVGKGAWRQICESYRKAMSGLVSYSRQI